ncbi:MAG: nucleoside deaminase [Candidatus Omnitrophica bacterium]|nr:nucleoside deaminase [Candidatus Omnitrophota bacterium]
MNEAILQAEEGIRKGQTPFGACIVRNGKIISKAHNKVWGSIDITAHAEIVAIRQACKGLKSIDLSGAVIYSTCEPCPMCFSACHWAKISVIIYGARIEDAAKNGFNELTVSNRKMRQEGRSKVRIVPDVMRKENLRLFSLWREKSIAAVY